MGIDLGDRIMGSVLGLAVGDALGAPVEGLKPGAVKNTYGIIKDYTDPEDHLARSKIYKWRKPGVYTDDTQQALVLLDSVLQDRGVRVEKIADRFAQLATGAEYQFGVYRGTGKNFRLSVTDMRQGRPWPEPGRDTAGNGAAMRIAPIALYFHDNESRMADAVARVSLLTHRNPAGISAAMGVARVISKFLHTEKVAGDARAGVVADAAAFCRAQEDMLKEKFVAHLSDTYEESLHIFSGAQEIVADMFGESRDRVESAISKNADKYAGNSITRPTLGFAPASVVYAIYLAALHAESFEKAVSEAVSSGGDADTIGAMVGAMSGALHGSAGIPERWLQGLANRKQLTIRAEGLADGKWPGGRAEDLYAMEFGVTDIEHKERLGLMRKKGVDFPERTVEKIQYDAPRPIEEKFDQKKFKREQRRLQKWKKFLPPDSWDDED